MSGLATRSASCGQTKLGTGVTSPVFKSITDTAWSSSTRTAKCVPAHISPLWLQLSNPYKNWISASFSGVLLLSNPCFTSSVRSMVCKSIFQIWIATSIFCQQVSTSSITVQASVRCPTAHLNRTADAAPDLRKTACSHFVWSAAATSWSGLA